MAVIAGVQCACIAARFGNQAAAGTWQHRTPSSQRRCDLLNARPRGYISRSGRSKRQVTWLSNGGAGEAFAGRQYLLRAGIRHSGCNTIRQWGSAPGDPFGRLARGSASGCVAVQDRTFSLGRAHRYDHGMDPSLRGLRRSSDRSRSGARGNFGAPECLILLPGPARAGSPPTDPRSRAVLRTLSRICRRGLVCASSIPRAMTALS